MELSESKRSRPDTRWDQSCFWSTDSHSRINNRDQNQCVALVRDVYGNECYYRRCRNPVALGNTKQLCQPHAFLDNDSPQDDWFEIQSGPKIKNMPDENRRPSQRLLDYIIVAHREKNIMANACEARIVELQRRNEECAKNLNERVGAQEGTLRQAIAELNAKIEQLNNEKDEAEGKLLSCRQDVLTGKADAAAKLDEAMTEFKNSITRLQNEVEAKKNEVEQARSQINEQINTISTNTTRIQALEEQKAAYSTEIANMSAALESLLSTKQVDYTAAAAAAPASAAAATTVPNITAFETAGGIGGGVSAGAGPNLSGVGSFGSQGGPPLVGLSSSVSGGGRISPPLVNLSSGSGRSSGIASIGTETGNIRNQQPPPAMVQLSTGGGTSRGGGSSSGVSDISSGSSRSSVAAERGGTSTAATVERKTPRDLRRLRLAVPAWKNWPKLTGTITTRSERAVQELVRYFYDALTRPESAKNSGSLPVIIHRLDENGIKSINKTLSEYNKGVNYINTSQNRLVSDRKGLDNLQLIDEKKHIPDQILQTVQDDITSLKRVNGLDTSGNGELHSYLKIPFSVGWATYGRRRKRESKQSSELTASDLEEGEEKKEEEEEEEQPSRRLRRRRNEEEPESRRRQEEEEAVEEGESYMSEGDEG